MFAHVNLLSGYKEPLWYKIPSHLSSIKVGVLVKVPLRSAVVTAIVCAVTDSVNVSYEIKTIIELESLPEDIHYYPFVKKLSLYYQISVVHLIKRMRQFFDVPPVEQSPLVIQKEDVKTKILLTDEQQAIVVHVQQALITPFYQPTLLHGVTGSGKTEVYKRLIEQAIARNKTIIFCLPEVTLATQFAVLFKQYFQGVAVIQFHSAAQAKEKKLLWRLLLEQKPIIIIGVHLPIMLPISNLGLIIIDEEHDTGYQEKKAPRINTKEAALLRAQEYAIPILLGSATPSFSSLYNVEHKKWHFFTLHKRFAGSFPTVHLVNLREQKKSKNFWVSQQLIDAIKKRLFDGEQTIIFLNRRGFSFFVQCRQCSFIFNCGDCSVSLTLHNEDRLLCHYCGYTQKLPECCTACKTGARNFLKKGLGTQQLVTLFQSLFPTARIARADLDVTVNRKQWHETMIAMNNRTIDILIGTQTITKGYHFPYVTLVGIIWADLNINFPLYNAIETTLQQIIQVAGRAGRQAHKSDVIIQAVGDHPVFKFMQEVHYLSFYQQELPKRHLLKYPPCARLVQLEIKHSNEEQVESDSQAIAKIMQDYIDLHALSIQILGPAKPPINKVKNIYMRTMYLKSSSMQELIDTYCVLKRYTIKSLVIYTPNPITL